MISKAIWGGVVALLIALVIVAGTLVGSAIALRQTDGVEAAALATVQTARLAKPGALPAATPQLVQLPGQARPRPGVAGVVLDVTGSEITVKSRQGPTARIVIGPNTVIRRRGKPIVLSDIGPGDQLVAAGKPNLQQRTVQAAIVVIDPPARRAPAS